MEDVYGDVSVIIVPSTPLSKSPESIYQGAVVALWEADWIPGTIAWRVYRNGEMTDIGENY